MVDQAPAREPDSGAQRSAVVDLGSNSVRLVVFEGGGPNPVTIFNEKSVLKLGRGLQASGMLNAQAVRHALAVLPRYATVARAMGADPFEVLATAAVRDASNGPAFVEDLRALLPATPIRVLSGPEEATLSAAGLLSGMPQAAGVLADIGGGSLELVQLGAGKVRAARTLPLGVIRLAERGDGDPLRVRALVEQDLATIDWLAEGIGQDLYLVGGAWRAIARSHMAAIGYTLRIVHHYALDHETARGVAEMLATAPRRTLERLAAPVRKRMDDLPMAAAVLRRLLQVTGARRVVFSANGLREGWYRQQLPTSLREQDGLLWSCRAAARQSSRDTRFPPALIGWTDRLFGTESPAERRLREAACWLSDSGSHDHPDYRAEQAFWGILRQPGAGLDHAERMFLALTVAVRYEAGPDAGFVTPTLGLLPPAAIGRALALGSALRMAYALSGGTAALLAGTGLSNDGGLVLRLAPGSDLAAGDGITRLLERLAVAMGLPPGNISVL